jgi:hypothetical protein
LWRDREFHRRCARRDHGNGERAGQGYGKCGDGGAPQPRAVAGEQSFDAQADLFAGEERARRDDGMLGHAHLARQPPERGRIALGVAGAIDDGVVGGDFALEHDAPAEQPHERIEPEDALDEALGEVGPVVVPTQMRVLMHDEGLDCGQAVLGGELGRDQDHWSPESDRDGRLDLVGKPQIDLA